MSDFNKLPPGDFNMPNGCRTKDIPGNRPEDDIIECQNCFYEARIEEVEENGEYSCPACGKRLGL